MPIIIDMTASLNKTNHENWSVYRRVIRTNNDVEGWHHRLNACQGA